MIDHASKQYLKPALKKYPIQLLITKAQQWLSHIYTHWYPYSSSISTPDTEKKFRANAIIKIIESLEKENIKERQDLVLRKLKEQGKWLPKSDKPWTTYPTVLGNKSASKNGK